jgi:5,10-methylenetetrahydromethanopterin reductase
VSEMGIDVSIGISPRESLADWAKLASDLEDRGVDRIWLIDSQMAMKDVYAGLITAALGTHRVQLGPGVTNLVTRDPTVTASAIAAVAEISAGRALLGVGAGDSAVKALGRRPLRIAELESGLARLRTLLGEQLPYAVPPVSIHLAVSRPRMCRLAGRVADGAIIMGAAQPDLLREQLGWIEQGIADASRRRSDLELSFVAPTSIGEDSVAALGDVRSWASAQARLLADVEDLPASLVAHRQELLAAKTDYDYGEHLSTRAAHQRAVSDELIAKLAVAGTAEHCATRLQELRETGIDRLIFPLMPPGRLQRLEQLHELLASHPAEQTV